MEDLTKIAKLLGEDNEKKLSLDDGVIVTPKIAERFNVKIGEVLTIESSDKTKYKFKINGITENYVSNYIYMTKEKYKEIFREDVTYNVVVSKNI